MFGGGGPDNITAYGGGHDVVFGQSGDDLCLSVFDQRPGDRVVGGSGTDTYNVDPGDVATTAEVAALCDSDAPEA